LQAPEIELGASKPFKLINGIFSLEGGNLMNTQQRTYFPTVFVYKNIIRIFLEN